MSPIINQFTSNGKSIHFLNLKILKRNALKDFKKVDIKWFDSDWKTSLNDINFDDNIDKVCNHFTERVHKVLKSDLKMKILRIKNKSTDEWMTEDVINAIKLKKKLENGLLSGVFDETLRNQYKMFFNHVCPKSIVDIAIDFIKIFAEWVDLGFHFSK